MLSVLVPLTYCRILPTVVEINAVHHGDTKATQQTLRRSTRSLDEIFGSLDPYYYRPSFRRVYASSDDSSYSNQNNFFYNPMYHNDNYYPHHKLFVPNLLG